MANCSDNSYVIYYTNLDKGTIQIQKSALITDELDIALIGKTRLEYGEIFNENLLHLLEHFACPEAPGNSGVPDLAVAYGTLLEHPTIGQIWYNKTQNKPFIYSSSEEWTPIGSINDVAGNSGVIAHGQFLPMPIASDGYNFTLEECSWVVSPFNIPSEVDFIHCFSDPVARVTMQYRLEGQLGLSDGFANYQIIGIRSNTNLGSIDCQSSQAPTSTPAVSPTPTPTPTLTTSITPTITPTVTVTATATITPSPTISATPGASVTPTPSLTPTMTMTATLTPTPTTTRTNTPTPTVTRSITVTPTPTPSLPVDDGDIFALALRPTGGSYGYQAYYNRRVQVDDTFDDTYNYLSNYNPAYNLTAPTDAKVGRMFGNYYVSTSEFNLHAFGVNQNIGVYNFRSVDGTPLVYKPHVLTVDDTYIYVGAIDYTNAPTSHTSRISVYNFDGNAFTLEGVNVNIDDAVIRSLHEIGPNKIMAVWTTDADPTEFVYGVYDKVGLSLTLNVNTLTLANGTNSVAVYDETKIAIMTTDNILHYYTFDDGTGFTETATRDYNITADSQVWAIQFDRTSGKLFTAYPDITLPAETTVECIEWVGGVPTVESSGTFGNTFATGTVNAIAVHDNRVLALDIADGNNPVMTLIGYGSAGFAILDTIAITPTNIPSREVAFVVPNYIPLTPTPTPTVTNTPVSPTPTPTISVTPTITPTITPSSSEAGATPTPTVTPTVTPTITPSATEAGSVPSAIHHWNFEGQLEDQIGTKDATILDDTTEANGVTLTTLDGKGAVYFRKNLNGPNYAAYSTLTIPAFTGDPSHTISAWVYATEDAYVWSAAGEYIISPMSVLDGDGLFVGIPDGSNPYVYVGVTSEEIGTPSEILGRWVQLVWVWTTSPNQATLYLDGVQVSTGTRPYTNAAYDCIGAYIGNGQAAYYLGDVKYWDSALSPSEISSLYSTESSTYIPVDPPQPTVTPSPTVSLTPSVTPTPAE